MSNGEIRYRWGNVWLDPCDLPVYPDDPVGYAIPWSRDRAAVIRYDHDTETFEFVIDDVVVMSFCSTPCPITPHHTQHEAAGGDRINVAGLLGVLSEDQHVIDAEAVTAMGAKANANPLNHLRFTDAEATTAMGVVGNANPLNHLRFTNADAVTAMGVEDNANPLNHVRYTDAEVVTAVRAKAPTVVNVAAYCVLEDDEILHVARTATGTCIIEFRSAQIIASNRRLVIKDAVGNASAFPITLNCQAGELIDGQASVVLAGDYDSITVYSDGVGLFII